MAAMGAVTLSRLDGSLAAVYADLYRRNAGHLALDPAESSLSDVEMRARLDDPSDRNHKFAVVVDGVMVGRVDLNPVAPPQYAIGYWIDAGHCGRGYGTQAVRLAVHHARTALGATDIYAGVVPGNHRSVRLLQRVGFRAVADMGDYQRFHLPLDGGGFRDATSPPP